MSAITFPGLANDRVLRVAWRPGTKLPGVDTADVGIVAAAAVSDPGSYTNEEIDLAIEALTLERLDAKLSKALGIDVKLYYLSDEK